MSQSYDILKDDMSILSRFKLYFLALVALLFLSMNSYSQNLEPIVVPTGNLSSEGAFLNNINQRPVQHIDLDDKFRNTNPGSVDRSVEQTVADMLNGNFGKSSRKGYGGSQSTN